MRLTIEDNRVAFFFFLFVNILLLRWSRIEICSSGAGSLINRFTPVHYNVLYL